MGLAPRFTMATNFLNISIVHVSPMFLLMMLYSMVARLMMLGFVTIRRVVLPATLVFHVSPSPFVAFRL